MINEVLVATTNNAREIEAVNALHNRSLLFNIDKKALYAKWDDHLVRIGSTPDNINIIDKDEKLTLVDIPVTKGLVVRHDYVEDWTTHRKIGEVSVEKPILLIFKKNSENFLCGEVLSQGSKETSHYNITFTDGKSNPFLSGSTTGSVKARLVSCTYQNEEWYGIHFFAVDQMNVYFSGWYTSSAINVGESEVEYLEEMYSGMDDKGDGFNTYMSLQEVFDKLHPVGETYVRYPGMLPPEELYNHFGIESKWELQSQYNGAFFRANGGTAQPFENQNSPQEAELPSIKGKINVGGVNTEEDLSSEAEGAFKYGKKVGENYVYENETWNNAASYQEVLFDASTTLDENGNEIPSPFTGTDIRPENYTIEIYKRLPNDSTKPKGLNIILTYEGISTMIKDEAERAKTVEARLAEDLNNEITRSTKIDEKNTADITNEVSRAKKAESDLAALLWQSKAYSSFQGLFNAMHPVDEVYVQYPGMPDPNLLYNKDLLFSSKWVLQSQYNGAFFRASGGNAQPFEMQETPQAESLPNIKGVADLGLSDANRSETKGAFSTIDAYSGFQTSKSKNKITYQNLVFDASSSSGTYQDGAEVKPTNYTINIWKRIKNNEPEDLPIKVITIDELRALIEEETRRAMAAENTISADLETEVNRAIAREAELDGRITSSENRAINVELSLATELDEERARAREAEKSLFEKIEKITDGDFDLLNIHTNQFSSTQPLLITRKTDVGPEATPLNDGMYSGIVALNYNGQTDGVLGIDKNGVARVGNIKYDEGNNLITQDQTKALAERTDFPKEGGIATWNTKSGVFETIQQGIGSSITIYADSESEARKHLPTYGRWEVVNIEYRLDEN